MAIGVSGFFDDDNFDDYDDYDDGLSMGIGIGTSDDRDYARKKSEDFDKNCSLINGGSRD